MCSSCSALSITTRYCNTKTGHKRSICHGKGIILYMSEILSLETCTQAFVWQRTGQYVSIGYDHNAEPFHSGMTWCSIVADVRQCTFHMHKSRPTIMLDSFSHYKIATSKSVDLLHAVWIIVFPLTYIGTRMSISTWQENMRLIWEHQSSTWNMSISNCWLHCRRSAKRRDVKTLRRTGLQGTIPDSLRRLRTVWSDILCSPWICFVVVVAVSKMRHPDVSILSGNVSLWRSHLDLTLSLSVVLHRAHKVESVRQETAKWLTTTCWAAPVCNLPMALSRWADVNLGIIAFHTMSLCGLFESLLVCHTNGWFGMHSYSPSWCTCYYKFCAFAFHYKVCVLLHLCESN